MTKYADVAPALPLSSTGPQTYTYRLPAESSSPPNIYSVVTVPFGSRRITGVITSLHNKRPPFAAKMVHSISPVSLTEQQFLFASFLARTMHGGLGYTLRLFKPPALTSRNSATHSPRSTKEPDSQLLLNLSQGPVAIINHSLKQRTQLIQPLISHFVRQNQQVLTVVPEKGFLPGPGYGYHGGLKLSAISAAWHGVKNGQVTAVRGTQKAVYLPFTRLGLIIVEEEQNPAHKLWDQYPRLSNIDAVVELARLHRCSILYLSSFPSWRLFHQHRSSTLAVTTNRPLNLKTQTVSFSFNDKLKQLALPSYLLMKLRYWSADKKSTLLLYNRLDNKKITQALKSSLSATQLSYCHLATSRVFAAAGQYYDRTVWLFPEQSINFPDYRSTEAAYLTVSRLHQMSLHKNNPVYLVTKYEPLIDRIFKDMEKVRTQELVLRERFFLPPFASQVRLTITAAQPRLTRRKSQQVYTTLQERLKKLLPAISSSILIRGPYSPLKSVSGRHARYIILRGPLEHLTPLYSELPVDSAELSPHRLI